MLYQDGELLVPRDEHAAPGRALRHGDGHPARPRRRAAARRRRRGAVVHPGLRSCTAGTRSSAASTPRTRRPASCLRRAPITRMRMPVGPRRPLGRRLRRGRRRLAVLRQPASASSSCGLPTATGPGPGCCARCSELEIVGIHTTVPPTSRCSTIPTSPPGNHSTKWVEDELDASLFSFRRGRARAGGDADRRTAPQNPRHSSSAPCPVEVNGKRFSVKLWLPDVDHGRGDGRRARRGARGPKPAAVGGGGGGGDGTISAPMQGTIVKVLVEAGDTVEAGQAVLVLEAMKMENHINAERAGTSPRSAYRPATPSAPATSWSSSSNAAGLRPGAPDLRRRRVHERGVPRQPGRGLPARRSGGRAVDAGRRHGDEPVRDRVRRHHARGCGRRRARAAVVHAHGRGGAVRARHARERARPLGDRPARARRTRPLPHRERAAHAHALRRRRRSSSTSPRSRTSPSTCPTDSPSARRAGRGGGENAHDLLVELEDASTVRALTPDLAAIAGLDVRGVVVTAAATRQPASTSSPASSHPASASPRTRSPAPRTARSRRTGPTRLGKTSFVAYQASAARRHRPLPAAPATGCCSAAPRSPSGTAPSPDAACLGRARASRQPSCRTVDEHPRRAAAKRDHHDRPAHRSDRGRGRCCEHGPGARAAGDVGRPSRRSRRGCRRTATQLRRRPCREPGPVRRDRVASGCCSDGEGVRASVAPHVARRSVGRDAVATSSPTARRVRPVGGAGCARRERME